MAIDKITKDAVESFLNATPFKRSNTVVEVLPNVTILEVLGMKIAYKYNDPKRTLLITDACSNLKIIRNRLNAIPLVNITNNKKGETFLNGRLWNGDLTPIK